MQKWPAPDAGRRMCAPNREEQDGGFGGHSRRYAQRQRTEGARVTRKFAAALLAAIAVFAFQLARAESGSAATGDVCPQTGTEQISASYSNGTLSVDGSGFSHLCDATLTIADPNGATTTATSSSDLAGAFTFSEPTSLVGTYQITASGLAGALASTNLTVSLGGPQSSLIVKLASGLRR